MRSVISLLLIFATGLARSGEVLESNIEHSGKRYFIHLEMRVNVNADRAFEALTDYANLTRLSTAILESTLTEAEPPRFQVRVVTDGCALFFCKQMMQLQNVQELRRGYILVDVDPEHSDFTYGRILWHIRPDTGENSTPDMEKTRVSFNAELAPEFWVPPLLGPMIVKKGFLTETRAMIDGIERIALEAENDYDYDIQPEITEMVPQTRTP